MASFNLFNEAWYLAQNPDVAEAVRQGLITAEQHFSLQGKSEGRAPGPLFNVEQYLARNPDVAAAVEAGLISAYDHFVAYGASEDRTPLSIFDAEFYMTQNPDVAAAVAAGSMTAVQHFLSFGQGEPRSITPSINLQTYLDANPDLKAAADAGQLSAFDHLLNYGITEGRDLGNGVNLSIFQGDPAFNAALTAGTFDAALARVDAVAPFLPGFSRPAGWAPAANTPIPTDFTPPAGIKLVIPADVTIPEGTTLPDTFEPAVPTPPNPTPPSPPAPTPEFTVTPGTEEAASQWTVGTQNGLVTLTKVSENLVFTPAQGAAVAVSADNVQSLVVNGSLTGDAAVITGLTVTGTGSVRVTGLEATANVDLSHISTQEVSAFLKGNATPDVYTDFSGNLGNALLEVEGYVVLDPLMASAGSGYRIAENSLMIVMAGQVSGKPVTGDGKVSLRLLPDPVLTDLDVSKFDDTVAMDFLVLGTDDAKTVVLSELPEPVSSKLNGFWVGEGVTLDATAAILNGKTASGDGSITINKLEESLNANLSGVATSNVAVNLKASADPSAFTEFQGNLGNARLAIEGYATIHNAVVGEDAAYVIAEGSKLIATLSQVSGKSVDGAGVVSIQTLPQTDLDTLSTAKFSDTVKIELLVLKYGDENTITIDNLSNDVLSRLEGFWVEEADVTLELSAAVATGQSAAGNGSIRVVNLEAEITPPVDLSKLATANVTAVLKGGDTHNDFKVFSGDLGNALLEVEGYAQLEYSMAPAGSGYRIAENSSLIVKVEQVSGKPVTGDGILSVKVLPETNLATLQVSDLDDKVTMDFLVLGTEGVNKVSINALPDLVSQKLNGFWVGEGVTLETTAAVINEKQIQGSGVVEIAGSDGTQTINLQAFSGATHVAGGLGGDVINLGTGSDTVIISGGGSSTESDSYMLSADGNTWDVITNFGIPNDNLDLVGDNPVLLSNTDTQLTIPGGSGLTITGVSNGVVQFGFGGAEPSSFSAWDLVSAVLEAAGENQFAAAIRHGEDTWVVQTDGTVGASNTDIVILLQGTQLTNLAEVII